MKYYKGHMLDNAKIWLNRKQLFPSLNTDVKTLQMIHFGHKQPVGNCVHLLISQRMGKKKKLNAHVCLLITLKKNNLR